MGEGLARGRQTKGRRFPHRGRVPQSAAAASLATPQSPEEQIGGASFVCRPLKGSLMWDGGGGCAGRCRRCARLWRVRRWCAGRGSRRAAPGSSSGCTACASGSRRGRRCRRSGEEGGGGCEPAEGVGGGRRWARLVGMSGQASQTRRRRPGVADQASQTRRRRPRHGGRASSAARAASAKGEGPSFPRQASQASQSRGLTGQEAKRRGEKGCACRACWPAQLRGREGPPYRQVHSISFAGERGAATHIVITR